jgi:hypothetical protein
VQWLARRPSAFAGLRRLPFRQCRIAFIETSQICAFWRSRTLHEDRDNAIAAVWSGYMEPLSSLGMTTSDGQSLVPVDPGRNPAHRQATPAQYTPPTQSPTCEFGVYSYVRDIRKCIECPEWDSNPHFTAFETAGSAGWPIGACCTDRGLLH